MLCCFDKNILDVLFPDWCSTFQQNDALKGGSGDTKECLFPQSDGNNSEVCRGDAGDTRGLTDRGWADGVKMMAGLSLETGDLRIVEVFRYLFVFHAIEPLNLDLLAIQMACVFEVSLNQGPELGWRLGEDFRGQGGVGIFRSAEPVVQLHTLIGEGRDVRFSGGQIRYFLLSAASSSACNEAVFDGEGRKPQVSIVLTQ